MLASAFAPSLQQLVIEVVRTKHKSLATAAGFEQGDLRSSQEPKTRACVQRTKAAGFAAHIVWLPYFVVCGLWFVRLWFVVCAFVLLCFCAFVLLCFCAFVLHGFCKIDR